MAMEETEETNESNISMLKKIYIYQFQLKITLYLHYIFY